MARLNELNPKYITDENGKKVSVVLPFLIFQKLLQDLTDLATVAERRAEGVVSHADLLVELKQDGLL